LITNGGVFTEKDRPMLSGFSSKKLVGLLSQQLTANQGPGDEEEDDDEGETKSKGKQRTVNAKDFDDTEEAPVTNADPNLLDAIPDLSKVEGQIITEGVVVNGVKKFRITVNGKPYKAPEPVINCGKPVTKEEWLKTAPTEIRTMVENTIAREKAEKDALIETIVANERNAYSKEQLATKDVGELQIIGKMLGDTNTQTQAAPNYSGAAAPTGNRLSDKDQEDILELPTMNWSNEEDAPKKGKKQLA